MNPDGGDGVFCAHCGAVMGRNDQFCRTCVADLTRPGSMRLTRDRDPDEVFTTVIRPQSALPTRQPDPASQATPVRAPSSSLAGDRQRTDEAQPAPPQTDNPAQTDNPPQTDSAVAVRRVRSARERQHQRRNRMAVTLVGLSLIVAAVPLAIVTYSFVHLKPVAATPTPVAGSTSAPRAPASAPVTKVTQPPTSPTPTTTPTKVRPPFPPGVATCGPDIGVNASTSCGFAVAVAQKVDRRRTGTFSVTATSPANRRTYTLSCTRGEFILCTGGRSAMVWIRPA